MIATSFGARLPQWVLAEIAPDPAALPAVEDRMRLVHRLADRNHREGTGGPFAAVVSDPESGTVIAVGVNLVLQHDLSSLHAEVVALSLARPASGAGTLGRASWSSRSTGGRA
jgi:tRNA(Arg) A34 adenosine deaminase TadA